MAYQVIAAPETPTPPPSTWSNMKVHSNGHFYVAGMAARQESVYEQAKAVFENIRRLLREAGGTMDDIMTMQIFVTDLRDNTEIWRARREFFSGDFPCSTLVQAVRVGNPSSDPQMKVEINCSGYIGGSR